MGGSYGLMPLPLSIYSIKAGALWELIDQIKSKLKWCGLR